MNDFTQPSPRLLTMLGSIAIHVDEMLDNTKNGFAMCGLYRGANEDVYAIQTLLEDAELRRWIKEMGALLPVKHR